MMNEMKNARSVDEAKTLASRALRDYVSYVIQQVLIESKSAPPRKLDDIAMEAETKANKIYEALGSDERVFAYAILSDSSGFRGGVQWEFFPAELMSRHTV